MTSPIKNMLHIAALLVALVGGAWLLMADSSECSGDDNEERCEKCGPGYDDDDALCDACNERGCFEACYGNADRLACAQSYNACIAEEESSYGDCALEAMCVSAEDKEFCLKCGPSPDAQRKLLCEACVDRTCIDACRDAADDLDCAERYNACFEDTPSPTTCRGAVREP